MQTGPDWVEEENSIAALFEANVDGSHRAQLLARLYAYAQAVIAAARVAGPIHPEYPGAPPDWLAHPVFICGHHRSGTTLLHRLLDGHPQLVVLPSEGTYFDAFPGVARGNPRPAALDAFAVEWVARFADPNFTPHFRLGRATPARAPSLEFVRRLHGWFETLRGREPARLRALLSLVAAFAAVVPSRDARAWIEKTPLNEHHVNRLKTLANSRFIHVVRQPGHALSSMRQAYVRDGRGATFDPVEHSAALASSMRAAIRNRRQLGDRYLLVRYEDLTADPAAQMEGIRDFIGIAPCPSLLVPTAGGIPVAPNTSFEAGAPGIVRNTTTPASVTPAERRLIESLAGEAARALGYPIGEASTATRAAARLRHALPLARMRLRRWIRHSMTR
jgi:hypothetical protein